MSDNSTISKRARKAVNHPNILLNAFMMQQKNAFNKDTNLDGIINLGTSENKISFDLVHEKLKTFSGLTMPEKQTHYSTFHGVHEFREQVADFLTYYMKPLKQFNTDDVYSMNGCGSIVDILAYSICDEGEGILIPAPFYGGFNIDISLRSNAICYPIHLSSAPRSDFNEVRPFQLSIQRMENALEQAKNDGVAIKGLLITNPNNPLGYVYSEDEMRSYMEFASKHNLHFISDEIYMLSIFEKNTKMISASAIETSLPKDKLHMIWGFSKDFGLSGFRCGILHTLNTGVSACFKQMAYFKSVNATTQNMLGALITDFNWIDTIYLPTIHQRLGNAYDIVSAGLKELNLTFVPSQAGFFVWVNFRDFIHPLTAENEMTFFMSLLNHGVYLAPSRAFFGNEIGWMRIIFSVPIIQCEIAMKRLKSFLSNNNKV